MADYKQLCAELLADYEQHLFRSVLAERARAALAEPEPERAINWPAYFVRQAAVQEQELKAALAQLEPEGPTEQEWDALVESAWDKYMTVGYQGERFIYEGDFDTALGFVREGLARWGNHPGSPDSSGNLKAGLTGSPADGEVVELAETLERMSIEADAAQQFSDSETLARAADLLERLSPPQPVPVSERLPGPDDCDAQGRCWHFAPAEGFGAAGWSFYQGSEDDTHWLPAHTLPLPTTSRSI